MSKTISELHYFNIFDYSIMKKIEIYKKQYFEKIFNNILERCRNKIL